MRIEKLAPCKVNLILNVLGRRPDGFHALETLLYPVGIHDRLTFERGGPKVQFECSDPRLPTGTENLVVRAAQWFLEAASIQEGVRIRLEKRTPVAAGLGGGSSNAAATLLGLSELFDHPLDRQALERMAATLGSDVPFFLQTEPALAMGRGERIEPVGELRALQGKAFFLVYPGFGVSTAWAYTHLHHYPAALHGEAGRAARLVEELRKGSLETAAPLFYNSLEAPVLDKYLVLRLYKDYLRDQGAQVALMSGSGSTVFAIFDTEAQAREVEPRFRERFGRCWTAVVPATGSSRPA